jgi:hypothetical protein
MSTLRISRRSAIKAAAAFSVPFVFRHHANAKPSETRDKIKIEWRGQRSL